MGSHSVTCHSAAVTFPPLSQPKLVLDLATPEGCNSELTWVVVISKIVYLRNTVTYLRNNWAVSWREIEPATESHKSNILTTGPPSHINCASVVWVTGRNGIQSAGKICSETYCAVAALAPQSSQLTKVVRHVIHFFPFPPFPSLPLEERPLKSSQGSGGATRVIQEIT